MSCRAVAEPAYHGPFVRYSGIQAKPNPLRAAGPLVVIGGHSPAAFRRAVEHGNGWFGFALDADKTQSVAQQSSRRAASTSDRQSLGALEMSVAPLVKLSADEVHRFEDLGVDRMVLLLPRSWKPDEIVDFIEKTAALISPS